MSHELIQRFIDALHRLEDGRDLDPIVVTFANDCNISNVAAPRTYTGQDGASTFWTHYRAAFGDIHSSFRNVIVDGDHPALEWTTTGTDTAGDPIEYGGVSILDMDGGAITHFRAFFRFGPPRPADAATRGERRRQQHGTGSVTSARPDDLKPGDCVAWKRSQGTTTGRVRRKLTSPIEINGHHVAATEDDSQFLVVSDTSGDEAAHKPAALRPAP